MTEAIYRIEGVEGLEDLLLCIPCESPGNNYEFDKGFYAGFRKAIELITIHKNNLIHNEQCRIFRDDNGSAF